MRLEVQGCFGKALVKRMRKALGLSERQVFAVGCPMKMGDYAFSLEGMVPAAMSDGLTYAPFSPQPSASVNPDVPMHEQIEDHDILLFYPYESMDAFVQLLREAAADPTVISIKITLYRLARQSHLAEALIAAGVARVVVGSRDPNPLVASKGSARLREAGIRVDEDVLRGECDELNPIFFRFISRKTPYVVAKWAMSADGKIACASGDARWVSGPESRRDAHELRHRLAAFAVGIDTVMADDPLLTCRREDEPGNQPLRVVLDSRLRTPDDCALVRSCAQGEAPLAIATCASVDDPATDAGAKAQRLRALGVEIECNTVVGKTLTVDELFEMGYKAVFVGSGAGLPMFMNIPGESLKGVLSANEYLTRTNLMKAYTEEADTPVIKSKAVAVVGGGNVAMDAARCAMRLGAEHVYIVYRRGEAEMPARLEEQHHAKEEGIEFKTLCNPVEILGGEDGRVNGIKCVRMELGEPDASGRRRPIAIEGSEFVLDVDTVIMALGTSPNPLIRSTTPGLDTNRKGCLIVDENEMTTRNAVFAGGDAVTGAATVILAMGAGKKGADAIDAFLKK